MKVYDVIIIGAGPAGITAGIYAKNFGLDCLIIGQETGGLINAAYKVENYPGIFNITGKNLTEKFKAHQKYLKVPFVKDRVELITPRLASLARGEKIFRIFSKKKEYRAKTLILAFGTETKKLDIKNIKKFEGKGVGYRIDDNVSFYKNKIVAIIGGANAAAMSAVSLSKDAKKIYLIYRREKLRADAIWMSRVKKLKNVEIIYKANIIDLKGKNKLEKIILDNKKPRTRGSVRGRQLKVNRLLIEAGVVPNTFLIHDLGIKTDKSGYIKTDKSQATNIKGIFAAGDATTGSNEFRQIITACSEAAVAVLGVFDFLKKR